MYLIRGQSNLELFREKHPKDTFIATIGNFDGLHLGHKEILKNMLSIAKRKKLKRMVIFTEPHAKEFFAEEILSVEAPPRISPWRDKYLSLKKNGVDVAFFLKFNSNLKRMTPEIFADDILGNLQIRSLMIGDDFKFGKDRKGDFNFLVNWGKKKGVDVLKTETFKINDKRVSSTRIREALINNDFEEAEILLDRPYTFSGKVVHGNQLGRTIDVPTANLWLPKTNLPIKGVYGVKIQIENRKFLGIANMGLRPTIGGTMPVLEVHIFNFSEDIYGQRIQVEFCFKVRDEKKFSGLDQLKEQIKKDISYTLNTFDSNL